MDSAKNADNPRTSLLLFGLFALGVFYTLYFAKGFFVPIVLALFLKALLRPAVEFLRKLHVPQWIGAALVVGGLSTGLFFCVSSLSTPFSKWMSEAPQSLRKLEVKFHKLIQPVAKITAVTEKVEEMTSVKDTSGVQTVKVEPKKLSQMVLDTIQDVILIGLPVLVLIYFLLAANNQFKGKFLALFAPLAGKKQLSEAAENIRKDLSKYLFTIVVINSCLGIVTGFVTAFAGLPNPALWGAMAALFNFIPYLGATASFSVITMVSFLTFDNPGQALIAPGIFLGVAFVEGMLITPTVLGASLTLNPVAIFVGMLFWGWLWGIPGAFLSVPILMCIKIFCDRIPSMKAVGDLLGH